MGQAQAIGRLKEAWAAGDGEWDGGWNGDWNSGWNGDWNSGWNGDWNSGWNRGWNGGWGRDKHPSTGGPMATRHHWTPPRSSK
jgi:hypothetical protein